MSLVCRIFWQSSSANVWVGPHLEIFQSYRKKLEDLNLQNNSQWDYRTHSEALSSLPPLVAGRKTLVSADYVTTQNLGGKKVCLVGGVAECFDWCCDKFCGFQNLEQSLKTTFIRIWCGILLMKMCYIISAISKIQIEGFSSQWNLVAE